MGGSRFNIVGAWEVEQSEIARQQWKKKFATFWHAPLD